MTEQEWNEELVRRMRRIYRRKYHNQKEFAEATGLSEMTISNYIRQKRVPDLMTIVNMAAILECDINELVPTGEIIE